MSSTSGDACGSDGYFLPVIFVTCMSSTSGKLTGAMGTSNHHLTRHPIPNLNLLILNFKFLRQFFLFLFFVAEYDAPGF